ncbi:cation diffusion facilitator family transporter [Brevundimonas sp.]|uniref:cation diffusion facilitator family transporter n=1 Tax=Brevundimonas sp. TaxID=1871086 RepID=UPI003BAC68DD
MTSNVPTAAEADAITRRITTLSVATAVVLIALKAFALGASGSVSILASLADSSLDLAASLVTFFAVRWAAAPPDEEHRFGHGKGEAMAALVQAGLILASAVFIGLEAVQRMFDPRPVEAGGWAVGVIVISILVTGGLIWMQDRAVKATGSLAVAGDRSHYAADMAAGIVVLIGVISGAWLGAPGLDAAAGLVVAVWLFWGAFGLLRSAADPLLDRSVGDTERSAITTAVLSDTRIGGVHALRTRSVGPVTMIQMHIDLEPSLSLADAHAIVTAAEDRIRAAIPRADILIHPDPRGAVDWSAAEAVTAAAETPRDAPGEPSEPVTTPKGPWA